MTKIFLFYSLLLTGILITSCDSENKATHDPALIKAMLTLQNDTYDEYNLGEEKAINIKEMAMDRSNPAAGNAQKLTVSMNRMDKECERLISLLEEAKKELFKSLGENINADSKESIVSRSYSPREPMRISMYSLNDVKSSGTSNILDPKGKMASQIIEGIRKYRKVLSEEIVSSNFHNTSKPFFFKDPNISETTDFEKLNNDLDKAINYSNVSPDDRELLKKIYMNLTVSLISAEDVFKEDLPCISAFGVIVSLQNEILSSRSDALRGMASRFAFFKEFPVSEIIPLVIGPEVANPGQVLKMEVLLAGYDTDRQPNVEIHGGAQLIEIKDGKGFIQTKVPNAKEMTIAGTISYRTRIGEVRTYPWTKTIKIVQ